MLFRSVSHPILSYRWIVDSGSSDHMSPEFHNFLEYFPMTPEPVNFGNGATGYALGHGNIKLNPSHGIVVLKRVLFVPTLVANLLSITRVMHIGTDVHFIAKQQKVYFTHNNTVICTASPKGGLVILDEDAPHTAFATSKHVHPETYAWHRKLGHLGFDNLAKFARKGFVAPGAPEPADFLQAKENAPCKACTDRKSVV